MESAARRSLAAALLPAVVALTGCDGVDPVDVSSPSDVVASQVSVATLGGRLVFSSFGGDGRAHLQVAVPGEAPRALDLGFELAYAPRWSPDGSQIAFVGVDEGGSDLYLVRPDGSDLRRLTTHPGADVSPAWAPDGRSLAFSSERDGNREIYTIGADGTGLRRITDHPGWDVTPAFSPDGAEIAFHSTRAWSESSFRRVDLFVMELAGGEPRRLTRARSMDVGAAWSPSGDRIVFSSTREGPENLYSVAPDGSGLTRLTSGPHRDLTPRWSPDGRHLVFTRALGSSDPGTPTNPDLFVARADGTGLIRLTETPGEDVGADWAR